MILEGIVTSLDAGGALNVAPMGPIVDESMTRLRLRPYQSSRTYQNLKATGCGVLHVVDDVLLIARAAIGRLGPVPETFPAEKITGRVLKAACRWYEFQVETLDDSQERTEIEARVVHMGRLRDVFGFNRARHAVLEAAILATRVHILPLVEILAEFERLRVPVEKTAGDREREAFGLLLDYVRETASGKEADANLSKKPEVVVQTGARLHCGLFTDSHAPGRQFGGVGMMISPPGFVLRAAVSDRGSISGHPEWHERLSRTETRARERVESISRLPPVQWTIDAALPPHAGLGSGTQLGLAAAAALSRLAGEADLPAEELATRAGRGTRSAIGIHGFSHGGFLVEGGKLPGQSVSPLVTRAPVPEAWRFVLIRPRRTAGLSGADELEGFARLPPMSRETTDRMCRLALLDLTPALIEEDFDRFGEALFEFGKLVGQHFAPVQGGVCADAQMRELLPRLRARGIRGIGQSSWGPTVFVLCRSDGEATSIVSDLNTDPACADCALTIASPMNRGATVAGSAGIQPVRDNTPRSVRDFNTGR